MNYIVVLEYETKCTHFEVEGEFSDAIFWARFYMWMPGVWKVWITDFTWGDCYFEDGVTAGL